MEKTDFYATMALFDKAAIITVTVREEIQPGTEEYFQTTEWKAFVYGYWDGYNDGQKYMKNPEYKDMDTIIY